MCSPVGIDISSKEESDCSLYEKRTDEEKIWNNNMFH